MPRRHTRGGHNSNHYMSFTGHRETYKDYCVCCSNFRLLRRFFNEEYYCGLCRKAFNQGLKKKKMDPAKITGTQERAEMNAYIEEMVEKRSKELADEKKIQQRDYKKSIKPWYPYDKNHNRRGEQK